MTVLYPPRPYVPLVEGETCYCADCWEPLRRNPDARAADYARAAGIDGWWRYARVHRDGSVTCRPRCDAVGCGEAGTVAFRTVEWDGSRFRLVARRWLCDSHAARYRREQSEGGDRGSASARVVS